MVTVITFQSASGVWLYDDEKLAGYYSNSFDKAIEAMNYNYKSALPRSDTFDHYVEYVRRINNRTIKEEAIIIDQFTKETHPEYFL